jgi:hypothetical protein
MRTAARVDENQSAIVDALRAAGCLVCITSQVGKGFPDLLVTRAGRIYLLEVKRPLGPRGGVSGKEERETQKTWRLQGWPVVVVRNVTEAIAAVGLRIVGVEQAGEEG